MPQNSRKSAHIVLQFDAAIASLFSRTDEPCVGIDHLRIGEIKLARVKGSVQGRGTNRSTQSLGVAEERDVAKLDGIATLDLIDAGNLPAAKSLLHDPVPVGSQKTAPAEGQRKNRGHRKTV